jgi:hypothetical protein
MNRQQHPLLPSTRAQAVVPFQQHTGCVRLHSQQSSISIELNISVCGYIGFQFEPRA